MRISHQASSAVSTSRISLLVVYLLCIVTTKTRACFPKGLLLLPYKSPDRDRCYKTPFMLLKYMYLSNIKHQSATKYGTTHNIQRRPTRTAQILQLHPLRHARRGSRHRCTRLSNAAPNPTPAHPPTTLQNPRQRLRRRRGREATLPTP